MFDMKANGVKVGDKLVTCNGEVCEVVHIDHDCYYAYELRSSPDNYWTVDRFGYLICDEHHPNGDIAGFADEQPRTSEVVPEPENKGVKSDQGKTQWSYLPIPAVKAVVDVMAYGDTKYPAPDGSNWKRVPDAKKRYYNAAMRHLTSWWDGEQNDPETGYNHLAHACSNLLFLLWFEIKGYPETKE